MRSVLGMPKVKTVKRSSKRAAISVQGYGDDLSLQPRVVNWTSFFVGGNAVSDDFMSSRIASLAADKTRSLTALD